MTAQKNSISPYSQYGIGSIRTAKFIRSYGLAGLSYGLKSDRHINPQNPASYHTLKLTSFEASFESTNLWMESGGQSQYANKSFFSHFALGVPIAKWWGMSLGLIPFSTIGYEYQKQFDLNSEVGQVTNLFEGSGGVNKLMMGHGFRIAQKFSFGFNASYMLGEMDRKERVIYDEQPSTFNSRKTDIISIGDLYLDFGLQFDTKIKEKLNLTTGITYAYADKIKGKQTLLLENYTGNIGFERIKDTVSSAIDEETTIELPNFYGVGFALEKEDKWMIGLDLDYSDWSNVSARNNESFSDAFGVRSGIEVRNKNNNKHYRFGARYLNSYININDEQLQEMALSLGVSLYKLSKVSGQRTVRGLNFGMEVGTRGKDSNGLIKEDFVNFMFSITINDKWFIKRKYN